MGFFDCCSKCCKQIQIVGLAFTVSPPSYDDLEKMLKVYALLTGLLLSMVVGCIFKDIDILHRATDIYGALFGSLELLFLASFIIVCLYKYLMMFESRRNSGSQLVGERWEVDLRWTADARDVLLLALPDGCQDVSREQV
ncbi:unnamed protein product [Prorocentrum cordatum]|uniref:Transmembrane protein 163 n=1 Tax=Prorocentrum cordatum TaxID=2364126 RepID=A0ABN9PTJ2_9DINO|nr:unnamed protein product [Polarella glacialis]